LCQNQEWGPQTANILISNEEIFLQASALYSYLYGGEALLLGGKVSEYKLKDPGFAPQPRQPLKKACPG
jgi:hypothetical protein